MNYDSTTDWLRNSFVIGTEYPPHNGWIQLAGLKQCGCILGVYKDSSGRYCAHAGDTWGKNEEPLFGYFSKNLTLDEVIDELAVRYDAMKLSHFNSLNAMLAA